VNKNSIVAFLLIAVTVIFFYSPQWNKFWYGTVLKKPVPTYQTSKQRSAPKDDPAQSGQNGKDSADVRVIPPNEKIAETPAAAAVNSPESETNDSAAVVQAVEDTVTVETDRLIAAVSTKGGRIVSLLMKDYKYARGANEGNMIDLLPSGSAGGAQLTINNESFDDKFFTVVSAVDINSGNTGNNNDADSINTAAASIKYSQHPVTVGSDGYDLVLETVSASGKPLQKVFSFSNSTYKIGCTVRGGDIAGQKITVGWKGGIEDSEAAQDIPFGGNIDKRRAHYSDGKSVNHFEMRKKGVEEPSGVFRWVGMSSKYFFVALVADRVSDADIRVEGRDISVQSSAKKQSKDVNIDYSVYYQSEAGSDEVNDWIYAGPGKISELSLHGMKFEKSLFPVLGWTRYFFWADAWFPPLAEILLKILLFFYGVVKDYGIAIFFLTLLSKIVTYPMTQSSAKSMNKMKAIQPKITALRQKYKNTPQKMNEEMMALYKAEGINPFNPGCLPMFLQMPIFIALFVVLRKAIELRGVGSFLLPWVKDLSQPEALFSLPFALPLYGSSVALMPIVMAALTFFQQKSAVQDPNQKAMIYMMPVIMLVMFNGFPAGVVFYWTVSSAISLVQQKWLPPKLTAADTGAAGTAASAHHKAPVKKKTPSGGKRKNNR